MEPLDCPPADIPACNQHNRRFEKDGGVLVELRRDQQDPNGAEHETGAEDEESAENARFYRGGYPVHSQ